MNDKSKNITLGELASIIKGEAVGDIGYVVAGACSIENPVEHHITFAVDPGGVVELDKAKAQVAFIVGEKIQGVSIPMIVHKNPRLGFTLALRHFHPETSGTGKIHPSAVISESATINPTADVGPNAVIEAGARIGAGSIIGAGCYMGENSVIGENTRLYPNVTVMHDVAIGSGCIFHPGVVIGGDGFGFEATSDGNIKMPQVGRVEIGDNVEVGANTTIDRATLDATVISDDVKLDNLVQIAHNVKIGSHTRIAAQAGLSGRAVIGENVVIAGQAGFNNGVKVGDNSVVGGRAGVVGDIRAGTMVSGYPAREHGKSQRVIAATMRLPKLMEKVERLEKELAELVADIKNKTASKI